MRENNDLNMEGNFEGALTTKDPLKVGIILNELLSDPSSALILEPVKNEYWFFFQGGSTFPGNDPTIQQHIVDQLTNINNSPDNVEETDTNIWVSAIIKPDGLFFF